MNDKAQSDTSAPPEAAMPLAIVGMDCLFPKAGDLATYWANLRDGVDAITDVPKSHWDPQDYFDPDPAAPDHVYARRGGFLDPVAVSPMQLGIAPRDIEATDTTQLLALHVAARALADAGYGEGAKNFDRGRASVVLGVTGALELVIPLGARLGHPLWRRALADAGVDAQTADDVVERIAAQYLPWQENSFPGLLGNVAAGRIANRLDLHGTNCVVDAACASSLSALHLAALELQTGAADLVLAGGVDTFNDVFMYTCFSKTPALSARGDARPFDRDADGTILGEGVGIVVLKRLADARRDGDRVYAVLRGIGASSDGKGQAIYAPASEGQARALRRAYERSGVPPQTIGLVEGHGTGTRVGDATEIRGLTSVFDPEGDAVEPWCALGSVKSMIGHTKAAAGIAGLIKAALALHHRVLPPTLKVEAPNDAVASAATPFAVSSIARPWLPPKDHPRRAGISAFGFGGSNFHAVLEEADAAPDPIVWDGDVALAVFSAQSRDALVAAVSAFPADAVWNEVRAAAAKTRAEFVPDAPVRLTLVLSAADDVDARVASLSKAATAVRADTRARWTLPGGVAFGEGAPAGRLAGLFPGQGAQAVGMLGDLACRSPRFTAAMQGVLTDVEADIATCIYPLPTFDREHADELTARLTATEVAQPALGAVSLGVWRVLEDFGVKLDAAIGHSYGELTALCVAGCIDDATLGRLSRRRGELMAQGEGDRGTMLAVFATEAEVRAELTRHGLDQVTIANFNAPHQHVVSGPTAAIAEAERTLGDAGLRTHRLSVAAAFHSPLVAAAREPFADALAQAQIAAPSIDVFANTTAQPHGNDAQSVRDALAEQLVSPVRFAEGIEAMVASGVGTFLEIGPGRRLSGLVGATAPDHVGVVAVDASQGRRPAMLDLAGTLGTLAAWGHAVALCKWDPAAADAAASTKNGKLTVSVCGANAKPKPLPPAKPKPTPTAASQGAWTPRPTTAPAAAPVPSSMDQQSPPAMPTAPSTAAVAPAAPGPVAMPSAAVNTTALAATQANLNALMQLQQQTADLHRRFLEGQHQATLAFGTLMAQQQTMLGMPGGAMPTLPVAAATPTPAPFVAPPMPAAAPPPQAAVPQAAVPQAAVPQAAVPQAAVPQAAVPQAAVPQAAVPQAAVPQAPVAPTPAAAPASPATGATTPDRSHVADVLVALVAEKTGYPPEMLELSMGLDADLGIDSIKRVEILSGLRERLPDAPTIGPEQLGQLQTLGHIVAFLTDGNSDAPAASTPSPAPAVATAAPSCAIADTLLAVVADKTGYPAEMLELSMGLDADLGIDSIKRVEILSVLRERLPNAPVIGPEQLGTLSTLGAIVEFLGGAVGGTPDAAGAPSVTAPSVTVPSVKTPVATPSPRPSSTGLDRYAVRFGDGVAMDGPAVAISGTVVVTGPGDVARRVAASLARRTPSVVAVAWGQPLPTDYAGLVVVAPADPDDAFVREAFTLVRGATVLRQRRGWLASISRMGGDFGLGGREPQLSPRSGALPGLIKTVAHEWSEVRAHALDLPLQPTDEALDTVLASALSGGPIEIGFTGSLGTPRIEPVAVSPAAGAQLLGPDDVVIVSGGARGVTAATALELAQRGQPTLVLLGRSPMPDPEPSWLAPLTTEAEINAAVLGHASERVSPRALKQQFAAIAAAREIRTTLAGIEAAGSSVEYRAVDVRDGAAVEAVVAEVVSAHGPITALLHGAGVLADKHLVDKTDDDFDRVYGTKVHGAANLLGAVDSPALRAVILFSSSTARFGRRGQADYAMANEVLNKFAQQWTASRPSVRTVAIGWGPWSGGMVTPALATMFKAEGVATIDLRLGAAMLADEITGEGPAEIVVVGGGSRLHGAMAPVAAANDSATTVAEQPTIFERQLTVDDHPFLRSHVLDGKAVLPTVMMLEWFAHAALAQHPGLHFVGTDDLRIFRGIRLGRSDRLAVRVEAGPAEKRDGQFVIPVALCSGGSNGHRVVHARAQVVLATKADAAPISHMQDLPAFDQSVDRVYDRTLFHGEAFRGLQTIDGMAPEGIVASARSAPQPREWMSAPVRRRWITDPLTVDSGLQAVIVWTATQTGAASLPHRLGRYRQFEAFPQQGARISVRVVRRGEHGAVADLDWVDAQGRLIARLTDCEYTLDAGLSAAFGRNRVE